MNVIYFHQHKKAICKNYKKQTESEDSRMAKIGSMELIVILIVAMLAIGPERMPKAARTLGKAVGSFKKIHERRDERPARGQRRIPRGHR